MTLEFYVFLFWFALLAGGVGCMYAQAHGHKRSALAALGIFFGGILASFSYRAVGVSLYPAHKDVFANLDGIMLAVLSAWLISWFAGIWFADVINRRRKSKTAPS